METKTLQASNVIPFLRSCKEENPAPINGDLTGEIPKWLQGCLIRVGSGLLEIGPDKCNHVFDGMALMHRFAFKNGQVTYQNRFLRSEAYTKNTAANRILVSEFGTVGAPDPCKTIFQRFASIFRPDDITDNDLVNIVQYGDEAFAATESNSIWKIDPETLDSIHKVHLKNYLPIDGALAHSHREADGTVYNMGTSYGYRCVYNVFKFPPTDDKSKSPFDNGTILCKIPSSKNPQAAYYHSFALTANYIILVEQPLYISTLKMIFSNLVSCSYAEALKWNANDYSCFKVVRRSDGQLLDTNYIAAAFFVFHHINAYEEDDHIVIDLCGYENSEVIKSLYVKALEEQFHNLQELQEPYGARARRYVLPLKLDKSEPDKKRNLVTLANSKATAHFREDGRIFCEHEVLTGNEPWSPELPRINYEQYNGRKYRYFYAIAKKEATKGTHLIKTDAETQGTLSWNEHGAIPSEPVFLANPESTNQDEDDGVIVASLLFHEDERKVALIVLDARTMTELGRVTFRAASSIPGDFHGTYFQNK